MTPAARISTGQNFFRFAYRIGSPISHGINVTVAVPPALVVFGEHSVSADELRISDDAFALCATLLERLAYRLLAMELNSALEAKFGNWDARRGHGDVLGGEPINLPVGRLARVRYAPMATEFRSTAK
jgi:hypothetical protein